MCKYSVRDEKGRFTKKAEKHNCTCKAKKEDPSDTLTSNILSLLEDLGVPIDVKGDVIDIGLTVTINGEPVIGGTIK